MSIVKSFRGRMNDSPLLRTFVIGSSWLMSGGAASAVLTAISTFSLAAYLGIEDYGTLMLIVSTVLLSAGILSIKTTEAVTKFLGEVQGDANQSKGVVEFCLIIELCSALANIGVLLLLADSISLWLFSSTDYAQWLMLCAVTILFGSCNATCIGVLRVANEFKLIGAIEVINAGLLLAGTVLLIALEYGWQEFIWWQVIVAFCRGLVLLHFLRVGCGKLRIKCFSAGRGEISRSRREILTLMLSSSLINVLKTAHNQVDTVLVGAFLGPAASGGYKLARNIVQMLAFPTNAMFQVSFTEITKLLHKERYGTYIKMMRNLIAVTSVLIIVYCIGMMFLAPYILPMIIGNSYGSTLEVLPVIVFGLSFTLVSQYWHASLVAVNRAGQVAISMLIALLFQVFIIVVLAPEIGVMAAVLGFIVYSFIRALVIYSKYRSIVVPITKGLNASGQ